MKPGSALSAPFIASSGTVGRVMRLVLYALLPGIVLYVWFFGWGVVVNLLIATVSALLFEALMLAIRRRRLMMFLGDSSAIVTAVLLGLSLPPMTAWWVPVVGSFIAIVIAKQLYGGLGFNPFNPAMAAYAVLLISFPREMSLWAAPIAVHGQALCFWDTLQFSLFSQLPHNLSFDAITSATPLDKIRTDVGLGQAIADIRNAPMFGALAGRGMEWINLSFLAGGCWLIYRRIISWHIPVSLLASLSLVAGIGYWIDPHYSPDPLLHLLGGASILAAFFIATDPVTAATTNTGKLIYGAGIGVLIYVIRTWGGYPDGVAFAVLLMGMTVPLLDQYTLPRMFGARRDNKRGD